MQEVGESGAATFGTIPEPAMEKRESVDHL